MTEATDKTKTALNVDTNILSVSEAADLVGTSTRTIERHATYTKTQPTPIIRNGRKVNGYPKAWLLQHFPPVGNDKGDEKQAKSSNKYKDTTQKKASDSRYLSEAFVALKETNGFLCKELEHKNEQIAKLQDSNKALIESERQTKTLLADLQFKQKELLLNAPKAQALGKKYTWFWWSAFVAVLGSVATGCYFGIEYLQSVFK